MRRNAKQETFSPQLVPAMHEVLTGELANRYGLLPIVPLPREDEALIGFVHSIGTHLQGKGIYRRDYVVLIPDEEKRRIRTITPAAFCSWSQRYVVTSKLKHDRNGQPYTVIKDMPREVASRVLESPDLQQFLPEIEVVHAVPLLGADGSSLLEPGFTNGVYTFAFDHGQPAGVTGDKSASLRNEVPLGMPPIRKTPISREMPYYEWTLEESVQFLRWLLREFPFSDWREVEQSDNDGGGVIRQSRSQAVQVAAMLSMFCMAMMPRGSNRMGFVYTANSQRSGKSLLAKLAITPVTSGFKGQSWKASEEELSKVIDAEMIAGSNYICFDNVRGHIGSPALESLMTSPNWTGRILKESQMFEVKNRMNLFITGNDCTVSPDMAHRCLMVELHINEGNVQDRMPSWVLDDSWLLEKENSRCILSALWGLVRSWVQDDKPMASSYGSKPRLGFEHWGNVIGGIVAYAGFGDCLEQPDLDSGGNSEERNVHELLDYLIARITHTRAEFTFQDVSQVCFDEGLFEWMLEGKEYDGVYTVTPKCRSALGRLLTRYAPSIDGNKVGRRYVRDGKAYLFGTRCKGRHRRYFIEDAQ